MYTLEYLVVGVIVVLNAVEKFFGRSLAHQIENPGRYIELRCFLCCDYNNCCFRSRSTGSSDSNFSKIRTDSNDSKKRGIKYIQNFRDFRVGAFGMA